MSIEDVREYEAKCQEETNEKVIIIILIFIFVKMSSVHSKVCPAVGHMLWWIKSGEWAYDVILNSMFLPIRKKTLTWGTYGTDAKRSLFVLLFSVIPQKNMIRKNSINLVNITSIWIQTLVWIQSNIGITVVSKVYKEQRNKHQFRPL